MNVDECSLEPLSNDLYGYAIRTEVGKFRGGLVILEVDGAVEGWGEMGSGVGHLSPLSPSSPEIHERGLAFSLHPTSRKKVRIYGNSRRYWKAHHS